MKYPLQAMLNVRVLRQENASQALTNAKRRVTEALAAVEKRKTELEEYKVWRVEEEARLFETIRNREIESGEVDGHRDMVRRLRMKDAEYEQRVRDAELEVEHARAAQAEAEAEYRRATKNREKIETHRGLWLEEEMRQQALAEDREMEEFTGKSAQRDDGE